MNQPPASLRFLSAALRAIDAQAAYYASVSGGDLCRRWEDAVDQALTLLLAFPEAGAPLLLRDPRLTGLRRWPVPGFPNHLLIYRYLAEQNQLIVVDLPHGSCELQSRPRLIVEQESSER
jgi:plasmid stabilization system protein ParE